VTRATTGPSAKKVIEVVSERANFCASRRRGLGKEKKWKMRQQHPARAQVFVKSTEQVPGRCRGKEPWRRKGKKDTGLEGEAPAARGRAWGVGSPRPVKRAGLAH